MAEQELSTLRDDFQRKMSTELTGGSFYRQTPRRPTRREVTPAERARREIMKERIPLHVSNGLTDEAIARTLSMPVALVSQYINLNNLRPKEKKSETSLKRRYLTREESEKLFMKWNRRIIELRDLEWTIEQISADIGLDINLTTEFIRRLIAQRVLEPRAKRIFRPSKLPAKYRQ